MSSCAQNYPCSPKSGQKSSSDSRWTSRGCSAERIARCRPAGPARSARRCSRTSRPRPPERTLATMTTEQHEADPGDRFAGARHFPSTLPAPGTGGGAELGELVQLYRRPRARGRHRRTPRPQHHPWSPPGRARRRTESPHRAAVGRLGNLTGSPVSRLHDADDRQRGALYMTEVPISTPNR